MHREETVSDLVEGNNLDEMRQKKVELEGSLQDLNLDRISLLDQIQQLADAITKMEEKNKKKQAKSGESGEPGEKQGNVAMLDAKEVAATVPAGESHAEG